MAQEYSTPTTPDTTPNFPVVPPSASTSRLPTPPASFVPPSRQRPKTSAPPQILLVLVGLPGSGKTTFAEDLVSLSAPATASPSSTPINLPTLTPAEQELKSRYRPWIRASQDDAPNRRRQECESRVRWGLREGYNVIVDRVGFDAVQRRHFIAIAEAQVPRPQIWCLVLSVSQPTLEHRLGGRGYHPTIPDLETGLRVLRQMGNQYHPPSTKDGEGEGFDRIYDLQESEQPRLPLAPSLSGTDLSLNGTSPGQADRNRIWDAETLSYVLDRIGQHGKQEVGKRRIVQGINYSGSIGIPRGQGWSRGMSYDRGGGPISRGIAYGRGGGPISRGIAYDRGGSPISGWNRGRGTGRDNTSVAYQDDREQGGSTQAPRQGYDGQSP